MLEIKKLVKRNKLSEALDKFEGSAWESEALNIQVAISEVENREERGLYHFGEYEVEYNRVTKMATDLLYRAEKGEKDLYSDFHPYVLHSCSTL